MPAIVKVKVIEGKDLPIMDRASDLTDAFVELRLGNTSFKTDVCRKSLNPRWDSDWFKFEVDDEEIQEEYLQIKVLDHDVYSSHDSIGKVTINLDTDIVQNGMKELTGYYPIYDTLHGIRGYIKLKIRIQFFMDANKYRQTSCGIKFFSASSVPHGYHAMQFQGFVEELLVDDDPEYQWIEKLRTSRASNEARQRHFSKLSGEVKRKLGLKVLEVGGNAVIGYQQQFDLEGETGIVVRGIGTAVTLMAEADNSIFSTQGSISPDQPIPPLVYDGLQRARRVSQIPPSPHGLSDSSDVIDHTADKTDGLELKMLAPRMRNVYSEDMEFPFFTINHLPSDFVLHLGGVVCARSVKLLDKINNPDEPETRDAWWNELRIEIRSHTKAMGCSAVIGYTESTTICDDLIVLTAYGTAAVVITKSHETEEHTDGIENEGDSDNEGCVKDNIPEDKKPLLKQGSEGSNEETIPGNLNTTNIFSSLPGCHICHVPYSDVELPLQVTLSKCIFCRQDNVPDVLFSTTDLPEELPTIGTGSLIQARVVRFKKKEKGESDAENVSQMLPFLEFDLHQQLINKLKMKSMNAIFGMKTKLSIGDQSIVAVVTGTAVYLAALPPPPVIVLSRKDLTKDKEYSVIQKKLMEITQRNREFYNLTEIDDRYKRFSGDHEVKDKNRKFDPLFDGKESYVFELDDKSDACIQPLLNETNFEGFHFFNTEASPGIPLLKNNHKFLCIFRHLKIPCNTDDDSKLSNWLSSVCDNSLMSMRLKSRSLHPCALTRVSFDIEITDEDYLQLTLTCFAVSYNDTFNKHPLKANFNRSISSASSNSRRSYEETDKVAKQPKSKSFTQQYAASWPCSKLQLLINQVSTEKPILKTPVIITPLTCIPNMEIKSYLGNVNLFLIRESTDLKEDGGVALFMQQFIAEVHAIIRAHVLALGGNAILSFYLNEIILIHSEQKNEAQCLINVSGDVASTQFESTDASCNLFCDVNNSKNSSIQSSPNSPDKAELMFKLDRAVYGTNV